MLHSKIITRVIFRKKLIFFANKGQENKFNLQTATSAPSGVTNPG